MTTKTMYSSGYPDDTPFEPLSVSEEIAEHFAGLIIKCRRRDGTGIYTRAEIQEDGTLRACKRGGLMDSELMKVDEETLEDLQWRVENGNL